MQISARPWHEWATRVYLHVLDYLSPDGTEVSVGGRQRHTRDMARVIQEQLGVEAVIVQKASREFRVRDGNGVLVLGLKCKHRSYTDPYFGWKTASLLTEKGDAMLYGSIDDAFPHYVRNAKGIHHGIWWDGPYPQWKKALNRVRTRSMLSHLRSVLSVDTNFINWVRQAYPAGPSLALKCHYLPNYADLSLLPTPTAIEAHRLPPVPVLVYARRFVPGRGPFLFLDAVRCLVQDLGVAVRVKLYTVGGEEELGRYLAAAGLSAQVEVLTCDLEDVRQVYGDADLAVVPTVWSEGTSLSCVEALCSGLPVVTTPVGGLGNLIIPGVNGLIANPEPLALARAMAQALEPETWHRLRRGALLCRVPLAHATWAPQALDWLRS